MATAFPTTLTGGLNMQVQWNAQVTTNLTGIQPNTNQNTLGKNNTWTFGTGAGQCNEIFYQLASITNGAPLTIDLTAVLEILGQTGTTFTKIKQWYFWLLAATDTSPDGTVTGNACSSITVGNAATPFLFAFNVGTTTYQIFNGGQWGHSDPNLAGYAVGAAKNVQIANNDAGNVAKVVICFRGAA